MILSPRSRIGVLAPLLAAVLLAGCGGSSGGGQSLDSISSCLKGKGFSVEQSAGDPSLQEIGYLTVTAPDNSVVMTVSAFSTAAAAKEYYSAPGGNSNGEKETLKGKLDLTGTESGSWAQKFDSCIG